MTNLEITDENYLANYERLEKTLWFQRNRARLYLYSSAIVYVLIGFFSLPEHTIDSGQRGTPHANEVLNPSATYIFLLIFFLILIAIPFFDRYALVKKFLVMKEFERQKRKANTVYDFNEKGVEIVYSGSKKEYPWNMFQTMVFMKQYLIFGSEVQPVALIWVYVTKENEADLSRLVTELQSKYKMRLTK